jgi:hypothetical protein
MISSMQQRKHIASHGDRLKVVNVLLHVQSSPPAHSHSTGHDHPTPHATAAGKSEEARGQIRVDRDTLFASREGIAKVTADCDSQLFQLPFTRLHGVHENYYSAVPAPRPYILAYIGHSMDVGPRRPVLGRQPYPSSPDPSA